MIGPHLSVMMSGQHAGNRASHHLRQALWGQFTLSGKLVGELSRWRTNH